MDSASCACSSTTCISWPVGGVPEGVPASLARSGAFLSDSDGGKGGGESRREPPREDSAEPAFVSVERANRYIFFPRGPCDFPAPPAFLWPPGILVWVIFRTEPPCFVAIESEGEPETSSLAILLAPPRDRGPGFSGLT